MKKQIKQISISLSLFVLTLLQSVSMAAPGENVVALLEEIIADYTTLYEVGVHDSDRPRLYILKKSAEDALNAYQAAPISFRTLGILFGLYSKHSISSQFFEFVETHENVSEITSLDAHFLDLDKELGITEAPLSRVARVTKELLQRVQELVKNENVSNLLKKKLNDLLPSLIETSVSAESSGDSPTTYEKSKKLFYELEEHYDLLEEELTGDQAMLIYYMEVVGLNELLGDYSEAN